MKNKQHHCYKCDTIADKLVYDDNDTIHIHICKDCADELLSAAVLADYHNSKVKS